MGSALKPQYDTDFGVNIGSYKHRKRPICTSVRCALLEVGGVYLEHTTVRVPSGTTTRNRRIMLSNIKYSAVEAKHVPCYKRSCAMKDHVIMGSQFNLCSMSPPEYFWKLKLKCVRLFLYWCMLPQVGGHAPLSHGIAALVWSMATGNADKVDLVFLENYGWPSINTCILFNNSQSAPFLVDN